MPPELCSSGNIILHGSVDPIESILLALLTSDMSLIVVIGDTMIEERMVRRSIGNEKRAAARKVSG